MSSSYNVRKNIKKQRSKSYLARDFESLRAELLNYSQAYFSNQIRDFSDSSLGGLLLDMAAYIGDNMSFYLDHQFSELNIETAVEEYNIENLIRAAGVKIKGAAPAIVEVSLSIVAPSQLYGGTYEPNPDKMPIIKAGTVVSSATGVRFELTSDLDFTQRDKFGNIKAEYEIYSSDSSGTPEQYKVTMKGLCTSAKTYSESFNISDTFIPFRKIVLGNGDVSDIVSVFDGDGNRYFEVESLTQDVVFKREIPQTKNEDNDDRLVLLAAPYRFISSTSRITGKTTVRFGSGDAEKFDDDIIPDPSDFSLPMYGDKKTFEKFSIDPNKLLLSDTLGISPKNTTITIRYRAGGGLRDNVSSNQITSLVELVTDFKSTVLPSEIVSIRGTVSCNNDYPARGGDDAPSLQSLKSAAIASRNSQMRIVTKQDLIARVYTMPSNFGRIYRVGVTSNPNNPLASVLSILSRDDKGNLARATDMVKKNLSVYLDEFRLVSDAIDIVDGMIINYSVQYSIVVSPLANNQIVIQNVNSTIQKYLETKNFQIGQSLNLSNVANLILNSDSVVTLTELQIINLNGIQNGRTYSDVRYNIISNTDRGILYPGSTGIFELKYPNYDIKGRVV